MVAGTMLMGCGSVMTSIEGHSVTGKGIFYAMLRSDGHEATVDLDGKKVHITTSKITWEKNGTLDLPASWDRLELSESMDSLVVNIDGKEFGHIRTIQ
jgi:hypothetical protein